LLLPQLGHVLLASIAHSQVRSDALGDLAVKLAVNIGFNNRKKIFTLHG
jgi:hypothetical protein